MNENEFRRRGMVNEPDTQIVAVRCSLGSFARFSRWIDGQLIQLERRWVRAGFPLRRGLDPRGRRPKPR